MKHYLLEAIGTGIIVLFGVGSVCTSVLTNAHMGIWQVAVIWGFGVSFAIQFSRKSGAHLNPAVSLAFLSLGEMGWKKCLWYIFFQMLGAFLAGWINYFMFYGYLGDKNTVYTAMVFGEYFPNPALFKEEWESSNFSVSVWKALFVEAFGTFVLMIMILKFRNAEHANIYVGFTVACLISLYAPLTQAGWNPARDFGPRLVAWCIGYGSIAIPGPRNGFWIYIVGPIIGAQVASLCWSMCEKDIKIKIRKCINNVSEV